MINKENSGELFENVLVIMKKQKELLFELLKEVEKKKESIINRDLVQIEQSTKDEISISLKMGMLEDEREKEVRNIANVFNCDFEQLNILELSNLCDSQMSIKLNQMGKEITGVIGEIKKNNELNSQLLGNAIEYVDFMLNIVTDLPNISDNNYSREGKSADGNMKKRMFDLKL